MRAALVPVALALLVVATGPTATGAGRDSPATRPPRFADHPAGTVFRGTPAAPDFKRNPAAERFGPLLREGARRGPNCQSWMIVNTKSGRIHDSPEPGVFGLEYQLNSRLLVVNTLARFKADDPPAGVPIAKSYLWRNDRFELIHTRVVPRRAPEPR